MPLHVELFDAEGERIDVLVEDSQQRRSCP